MKWQGKGVSEGLAMAQIHLFTPKLPEISRQPAADAEAEVAKLEKTLAAAEEELRGLYETAKEKMGEQEAEIFDAHLTILGDEYSVPGADHPAHPRAEAECRRSDHGPVRRAGADVPLPRRRADGRARRGRRGPQAAAAAHLPRLRAAGPVRAAGRCDRAGGGADAVRHRAHGYGPRQGHRHEDRRARRRTAPSLRARSASRPLPGSTAGRQRH